MTLDQQSSYSPKLALVADQMGISLFGRYDLSQVANLIECDEADVKGLIDTGELRVANTPTSAIKIFGLEVINYLFGDVPVEKIVAPRKDVADKMLKISEIVMLVGVSRSTIDRMEFSGQFPARIKLSARRVAWRESEVVTWMSQRK